jgi:beta-galactosidase
MKSLKIFAVLLLAAGTSLFAAQIAPRERLLMDYGWRFYIGDAPDAGNLFDYPEFKRLDKTRPDDDAWEAANAPSQVDADGVEA